MYFKIAGNNGRGRTSETFESSPLQKVCINLNNFNLCFLKVSGGKGFKGSNLNLITLASKEKCSYQELPTEVRS